MKIKFAGAAQGVTGSQTVFEHLNYSGLIDCGLYQGPKELRLLNWETPDYFNTIQSIIITHAHIDHSGLLPRWAHWGFQGPVYCTEQTYDLLQVMLIDSARLQEEDARFANETKHSRYDPALPLYTLADAQKALRLLKPALYNQWIRLSPEIEFCFRRAGHILGSALVEMRYSDAKTLLFSGDIGGGHSDLMPGPDSHFSADSLVLESTYGDRSVHWRGRENALAEIIVKVITRGGTLVVPAFALGRTQDLLFSILKLIRQQKVPKVAVYIDSPMANAVTSIYSKHLDELRRDKDVSLIEEALSTAFYKRVENSDESMMLCLSDNPKIIISASGMLQGGRVLHHLKRVLPHSKNGVLFVGFQGEGTKGRLLLEGAQSIRLHHQEITVEAEIFKLEGYSAHADSDDLIRWLKSFVKKPKKIFLNHGEINAQKVLAQKIKRELDIEATIPARNEIYLCD